jgi:hypothetical protein
MPGLAATYAPTRRARRLSVEALRHRFKAVLTGYGGSSSGCATADIYWEMPNTKPCLQASDGFRIILVGEIFGLTSNGTIIGDRILSLYLMNHTEKY